MLKKAASLIGPVQPGFEMLSAGKRSRGSQHVKLIRGAKRFLLMIAFLCLATEGTGLADSRIASLAKQCFYGFAHGKVDRARLDANMNRQLTNDMIRAEGAKLRAFGKPLSWRYLGSQRVLYATGFNFVITFAHARIVESIAVDSDGKIGGIDFQTYVEDE